MEIKNLIEYWHDIPTGKENAITYDELHDKWHYKRREVRKILQALNDCNGLEGYILIRSAHSKGFYKTNDRSEIIMYKDEMLKKANAYLEQVKKVNALLNVLPEQTEIQGT